MSNEHKTTLPKPTREQRAVALLRDVVRSGGRDNWGHLSSHGHSFSTVWSCVHRGWLSAVSRYQYEITMAGRVEALRYCT